MLIGAPALFGTSARPRPEFVDFAGRSATTGLGQYILPSVSDLQTGDFLLVALVASVGHTYSNFGDDPEFTIVGSAPGFAVHRLQWAYRFVGDLGDEPTTLRLNVSGTATIQSVMARYRGISEIVQTDLSGTDLFEPVSLSGVSGRNSLILASSRRNGTFPSTITAPSGYTMRVDEHSARIGIADRLVPPSGSTGGVQLSGVTMERSFILEVAP